MSVDQDGILCSRAVRGDQEAAYALIDAHYRPIYRYLRRLCANRQDAEDLTQETFAKVWSSLESYKASFRFTTWLYSIAYHVYIDWCREKKSAGKRPDEWWNERRHNTPDPREDEADRQMAEHLYRAVERLDDDKRLVVHLHYYEGLSLRETSQVLNVATSTVKYRLREVMRTLLFELDADRGDSRKGE
jgi:RNA polymerase sigma-70 factor (ECF subfamily)